MAPRRHDDLAAADAARDIERVLRAEREAEAQLAAASRQAQALLEVARDEARAIVERALERGARRQAAHAAALERRLATRRQRALAAAQALAPIGDAQLAVAVDRLAARLTGADGHEAGGIADDAG
jgi:vacuolar-type H+-ATPase subunit H